VTEQTSDRRLEAVLVSIGQHLAVDEPAALHSVHPIGRRRSPRLLAAAAMVAIVAASILMVAPARRAVANWLGIGSTRIEVVSDRPTDADSLPSITDESEIIPFDEAEAVLGRPLPDTSETVLGRPDAVDAIPEGGVLIVWFDDDTTLWIRTADPTGSINTKLIGPDAEFRPVTGLGDEAVLITGDHVLQTPQRQIAAGTVLLWISDDIEYRLESTLTEAEIVEIARAIK
jgi:hypothetical protein